MNYAHNHRIDCRPNELAAYLFMFDGDPIPPRDPRHSDEQDDEVVERWSFGTSNVSYDYNELTRFIRDVDNLCRTLLEEEDVDQYMVHFYDAAKNTFFGDSSRIREWFRMLYLVMFQRPDGSRWGEFVQIYGVENFVQNLRERFGAISGRG